MSRWLRCVPLALVACGCASEPEAIAPSSPDAYVPLVEIGVGDSAVVEANAVSDVSDTSDALPPSNAAAWQRSTIYFAMIDRFHNGDETNDGAAPCFDPTNPRRYHGGDLDGLRLRLDYLEELGVDTIWITPVQKQQTEVRGLSCAYHGYWADLAVPDDEAIEPRVGGAAALTALIDAMHARKMRLIVDLVVNHAGHYARVVSSHPEWFHARAGCEALGDPEQTCPLSSLPDFAQEKPEVAAYLDDLSARFTARFAFDGIRMDTVKHVPATYFRDGWVPAVRAVRPSLYLLGELFDEDWTKYRRYLESGFDGLFHFPLRSALVRTFAKRGSLNDVALVVERTLTELGQARARLMSTFIDNHDLPRFPNEMPADMLAAERRDRQRLALAVLFTAPGIPKLNFGDELGVVGGNDPENRADFPAWAFEKATRATESAATLPDPAGTFELVRRLSTLRRDVTALHAGDYYELWRPGGGSNTWAFVRAVAPDSEAIVVFHLADTPLASLSIPLATNPRLPPWVKARLADGTALVERLPIGGKATLTGGRLSLTMPARSATVFTR